jgi:D-beta-D-heptose 7-phosphate kinase/D-beta-D-heptose 1-phosphate adenosyltransferase
MNILVLGDIMLDINYTCNVTRNAPEAQIPIYEIQKIKYILGGSGNVAQNLNNLRTNVEIITILGDDIYGKKIQDMLNENNIKNKCFIDNKRNTTQKNRLFYNGILVNRFDIESLEDIDINIENLIYNYILEKINKINAIIISDYNKGVITNKLCEKIINISNENNIPTFIDPKLKNIKKYSGCFCFKPNMFEAIELTKKENIDDIFDSIRTIINPNNIIITDGSNGMYLNNSNNHYKNEENINALDVTGAGDNAICILVYIWLLEKNINLGCSISNFICGKSVEYIGNYNLSINDIYDYYLKNKIIYDHEIDKLQYLNKIKQFNKIVFTNGCFDIIHSAHIKLLNFSKKKGDLLIIGLNSDDSIKRLKGSTRPINKIDERSELLLNLQIVDYIVIFNDDTPFNILSQIKPNILIKGGDYNKDNIIGKEFVDEIILFDFINGKSTSNIIKQINQSLHL